MARSRAACAVLATALLGSAGWGWWWGGRAAATFDATVVATVDGDTIDVRIPGGRIERVRILGADTPDPRKGHPNVIAWLHASSRRVSPDLNGPGRTPGWG